MTMRRFSTWRILLAAVILVALIVSVFPVPTLAAGADRYFVMGQILAVDGTADITPDGRFTSNQTLTVSGAGTFTLNMANGSIGSLSGANISGSPVSLVNGANTITATGAGNCTLTFSYVTGADWNSVYSWAATSGGCCGVTVPTVEDDVYFDSNSFPTSGRYVDLWDSDAGCFHMDWTGANDPTLKIRDNTLEVYGNLTLANGMTVTSVWPGNIRLGWACNLTTNGCAIDADITINSISPIELQDNLTMTSDLSLYQGTLKTNNHNVSVESLYFSQSYSKTFTPGSSVINCSSGLIYSGSNLTVSANTSTINLTGSATFMGGNITTWNDINLNGNFHSVSGSFGCHNITRNGTANKDDALYIASDSTITCNTFAVKGNSAVNRLLVRSSTSGIPATVTATNWSGSQYVDLMDITATNAVDLSSITGNSGDCGGNTNITLTAAQAQTSTKAGSWADATMWSGRIPLPQDDVTVTHTVQINTFRIGKNITFDGPLGATCNNPITLYGSLTMTSDTFYNADSCYFRGRGNHTLTLAGNEMDNFVVEAPGGTLTLQDTYRVIDTTKMFDLYAGTVDFNDQDVYCGSVGVYTDAVKTLKLGNGTITLTGSSGSKLYIGTDNTTFEAEDSTIILTTSVDGSNPTFNGNGCDFNEVCVQGVGNHTLTVTGSNYFALFSVDAFLSPKTVKFTDGTTTTVDNFTRDAGGTNLITLTGTGTERWNLTKTDTVPVSLDYLSVSYSRATQQNVWYAGTNSINGTGNVYWTFTDPVMYPFTDFPTGITMDKDGITGGNFNGWIYDMDGNPVFLCWFEYGTTTAYGDLTPPVVYYSGGETFTEPVPTDLMPGQTYHYRMLISNNNGTYYGDDREFTFTQPSVTVIAATGIDTHEATLKGTISDMQTASTAYVRFDWGFSTAYGEMTDWQTVSSTGDFTHSLTELLQDTPYHYRMAVRNGTVISYSSDVVFVPLAYTEANSIANVVLPIIFAVGLVFYLLKFVVKSDRVSDNKVMVFVIIVVVVLAGLALLSSAVGILNLL